MNVAPKTKTKMKTILSLVAVLMMVLSGNAEERAEWATKVNKFDMWATGGKSTLLEGHGTKNKCSVYAITLTSVLAERGIKSAWVAVKWAGSDTGHSFVIFEKGGKLWAIDNEMAKPVRVSGKTDLAIAKKLYSLRSPLPVEKVCNPMFGTKSNAGVSELSAILK